MDFKTETIAFLLAFTLACVATWPLMLDPTVNISRHFDLYGTLWLTEGSQYMSNGKFTHTNFPTGATVGHIDSWLWFIVSWFNHGLISVERLLSLMLTGSLALNIWASRWCARIWGVSENSAWTVGILSGLSGSMLNSVLEGSWYLTSQFWLPLVAGALLRFQQTRKRSWYILMHLSWLGSLLTSAYLGMAASLMLLFLALYIQPYRRRKEWLLRIIGPVIGMGSVFTLFFLYVNERRSFDDLGVVGDWATMGSLNFWNYLFWTSDLDTYAHSLGPIGNVFILIAIVSAPFLKPQSWKIWWLLSIIGLALSFGFELTLQDEGAGIPWILAAFTDYRWMSFIHFPVRFHWITDLSGAILFGLIVSQFIPKKPLQILVGGLVCIHVFWIQGWLERKGTRAIISEPVYSKIPDGEGAIFEVHPVFSSYSNVDPLDIKNQICFQQTTHHRPLLISCMGTRTDDSVDWIVRTAFLNDALTESSTDWTTTLLSLGVDTLVFHRDLFTLHDASLLENQLEEWFGEPSFHSENDDIQIWSFSGLPATKEAAQHNLRALFPEGQ